MNIKSYTRDNLVFIEVTNDDNLTMTFCNLGASIYQIKLDDKIITRNALNITDFKRPECYYGKTIGRVANRIKGSTIKVGDKTYKISANENGNVLHGGSDGLSNQKFEFQTSLTSDSVNVVFTYLSPDGESGFPGNLNVTVKYVIYLKKPRFDIIFEGNCDKDTPLSLTNHTYFTLGDSLEDLSLKIEANRYLDVDDEMVANGCYYIHDIMDFNRCKKICKHIDHKFLNRDRLKGYDHFFLFDKVDINSAKVSLKGTNYTLDISSDFEGVQIYTSNHKPDFKLAPECEEIRDAVALEPSDNHLNLHILEKGKTYNRHVIYNIKRNFMENAEIKEGYRSTFGHEPQNIFSCGGRFEILGNHTDHNHGLCLAATCNLAITAGVSKTEDGIIQFISKGYRPDYVSITNLQPVEEEKGSSQALIRGVAEYLVSHGYKIGSFNAYSESTIFPGAGVSSSAAFELLIGQIFNVLFNEGKISKLELAKAGQYAENVYFGKASGLLDQIGVAFGNIAFIDFKDIVNPVVEEIPFPFEDLHFVIINTGGSHAELSHLYSAIPQDMYNAAKKGGADYLRDTSYESLKHLSAIEDSRARHFYSENARVAKAVDAIRNKDKETFLRMINESRISSTNDLKNMMVENQYIGSPLEACDLFMEVTGGEGAIKINGGGFAGSVISIVDDKLLPIVLKEMGKKYGVKNVQEVLVRKTGPIKEE